MWFDFGMDIEEISGKEDVYIIFQTETGVDIWGSFLMNIVRLEIN